MEKERRERNGEGKKGEGRGMDRKRREKGGETRGRCSVRKGRREKVENRWEISKLGEISEEGQAAREESGKWPER